MSSAIVTSKGQITIPKEVRDRLRLRPGTRVRFVVESSDVASLRRETVSVKDLAGFLAPPRRKVTVQEMNRAVQQAAVSRLKRSQSRKG
jgi:antitoxin PrlF